MAVVMEYVTQNGVHVTFEDDAYAGCSQAEIDRRIENIRKTAYWAAACAARRRKERESKQKREGADGTI